MTSDLINACSIFIGTLDMENNEGNTPDARPAHRGCPLFGMATLAYERV